MRAVRLRASHSACNKALVVFVHRAAIGPTDSDPMCLLGRMDVPSEGAVLACVPALSELSACQS